MNFGAKHILSVLFLLLTYVSAYAGTSLKMHKGILEMNTCRVAVAKQKWKFTILNGPYAKYWDAPCGYPPAVGTFLFCAYNLTSNNTEFMEKTFYKNFAARCKSLSSFDYDADWYADQFTNATEEGHYTVLSKVNTSVAVYKAYLPNMKSYSTYYHLYNSMNFNSDSGTWFSVGICGYFLFVFLIASIYNFLRYVGVTRSINNSKIAKYIQGYIIFPALFKNGSFFEPYGIKYLTILFPNRIELIVDFFLFILQCAFYGVHYMYSTHKQWAQFLGYRSGIMAFGKIPLLILFAGRNNFLLYCTGWSYSTFMHYHKITAFWMFVDSVIHSVAFTIDYLGSYVAELKEVYFAAGVAATVFCGVLILHSFHGCRTFYYEYFLTIHIVLVICFLATCWWHALDEGNMEWMIAACCVWFFDRFVRWIRMAGFGYRTAQITVVGDELMKIEVPKPALWFHAPGTYGYIYFASWLFWENHPFTVVVEDNKICAYIRVKRGVTARVWKKLIANNNSMQWRVCIEGPYGGNVSALHKKYDDAIFIAGGSGIPGILESAGESSCGKLIWISQTLGFVTAYHKLLENVTIPIDIYITRETAQDRTCSKKELLSDWESDSQSTDSDKFAGDKETADNSEGQISIQYGRPDIETLVNTSVTESNASAIAVVACGPPIMMDNLRNTISNHITSCDKSVDFFNEFQTW